MSAHATDAVLDLNTVSMLKELGGPSNPTLYRDLVELFREDGVARIDRVEAAVQSGDLGIVACEAHTLKSSSGNMGANMLRALCANLEVSARESKLDPTREMVTRLRPDFERACAALRTTCDDTPSSPTS